MMGVEWIQYTGEDGTLRTIRQAWTSAATVDLFVGMAAGRSPFRVSDLLALAALLDGLVGDDCGNGEAGGAIGGVKEILSHL